MSDSIQSSDNKKDDVISNLPDVGFSNDSKVKKSEELWLMSFSDMSLVLLCFFVLLITRMSEKRQPIESTRELLIETSVIHRNDREKEKVEELAKKVSQIVKAKNLESKTTISVREKGIYIEFPDGMFFVSGSAQANKNFKKTTNEVLSVIAKASTDFHIRVEGHTDDTPLRKGGNTDGNWELSADRAFSVMRMFHRLGVNPKNTSIEAFASTKPRVPLQSKRGKRLAEARAQNRRVAIWLHLKD